MDKLLQLYEVPSESIVFPHNKYQYKSSINLSESLEVETKQSIETLFGSYYGGEDVTVKTVELMECDMLQMLQPSNSVITNYFIRGTYNEKEKTNDFHSVVLVKKVPTDPHPNIDTIKRGIENERLFYCEYIDNLKKHFSRIPNTPRCLGANNNILCLVNECQNGYIVFDKSFRYMKITEVKLVIKEVARLHASSFVYESKYKYKFDDIKQRFKSMLHYNLEHFETFDNVKHILEVLMNVLKEDETERAADEERRKVEAEKLGLSQPIPADDLPVDERIVEDSELRCRPHDKYPFEEKVYETLARITSFCVEDIQTVLQQTYKHSVLCHGELFAPNMLFKGTDEVMLLDFQNMRYTSPAYDLSLLFYSNLDPDQHNIHRHELLQQYLGYMEKFINEEGVTFPSSFNFEWLNKEIVKFSAFAIVYAICMIPTMYCGQRLDRITDPSKLTEAVFKSLGRDFLYRIRVLLTTHHYFGKEAIKEEQN